MLKPCTLLFVSAIAVGLFLYTVHPARRPAALLVRWGLRTSRRVLGAIGRLLEYARSIPFGFHLWAALNVVSYLVVSAPEMTSGWLDSPVRARLFFVTWLFIFDLFVVLGFLLRLIEEDAFTDGAIGREELHLQGAGVLRDFSAFCLCCVGVVLQTANVVVLCEQWLGDAVFNGKPTVGFAPLNPLLTAAAMFPLLHSAVDCIFGSKMQEANAWGGALFNAAWFLGNTVMVAGAIAFFQQRQNLIALLDRLPDVAPEEAHYLQIRASRSGNFLKQLILEKIFASHNVNRRLLPLAKFARLLTFPERFLRGSNYQQYDRETRAAGRYATSELLKESGSEFRPEQLQNITRGLLEVFPNPKTFSENAEELNKERRELLEILVLTLERITDANKLDELKSALSEVQTKALADRIMLAAVAHSRADCRAKAFALLQDGKAGKLFVKFVIRRLGQYTDAGTRIEMFLRAADWSTKHWNAFDDADLRGLRNRTAGVESPDPQLPKALEDWRAALVAELQRRESAKAAASSSSSHALAAPR